MQDKPAFLCFPMRQVININKSPTAPPHPQTLADLFFSAVVTDVWPTAHSCHLLANNRASVGASCVVFLSSAGSRRAPRGSGVNLAKRAVCHGSDTIAFSLQTTNLLPSRGKENKEINKNSTPPSSGCGFTRPDCTISLRVTAFYRR